MIIRESVKVGDSVITLETGRIARQAQGSVLVTCGETVVLVTGVRHAGAASGHRLPAAQRRLRREDVRRGQNPGRLLQARRSPARPRDPDLAVDRPAVPAALPRRLSQRGAGHRDRALGRQGTPVGRARHDRRIGGAAPVARFRGRARSPARASAASTASGSPTRPTQQSEAGDVDIVVSALARRDRDGRRRVRSRSAKTTSPRPCSSDTARCRT